jgi:hypothetical protein
MVEFNIANKYLLSETIMLAGALRYKPALAKENFGCFARFPQTIFDFSKFCQYAILS